MASTRHSSQQHIEDSCAARMSCCHATLRAGKLGFSLPSKDSYFKTFGPKDPSM